MDDSHIRTKWFSHNLIPFRAIRVLGTKVLFVNDKRIRDLPKRFHYLLEPKEFVNKFSYVLPDTPSYSHLQLDYSNYKTLYAERYGGAGLGFNGGGGRCGNDEIFQIKGIGMNSLVGVGSNIQHSYGGLDLVSALKEGIFSELVNEALPLGATPVLGVILLSEGAGYQFDYPEPGVRVEKSGPAALLIRVAEPRPGHFLPSPGFVPCPKRAAGLSSERFRVSRVNKLLLSEIGGVQSYVKTIGSLLDRFANQFAKAQLLGIAHKALTPSNISLSGRWLDLPIVNAAGAGMPDIPGISSYYNEPDCALAIVHEMVHTFAKHNGLALNFFPLKNYYVKQFEAYLSYYFPEFLGVNACYSDKLIRQSDIEVLLKAFKVVVAKGWEIDYDRSFAKEKSPASELISNFYKAAICENPDLPEIGGQYFGVQEAVKSIFSSIYNAEKCHQSYESFLLKSFFLAIRRSWLIKYFYCRGDGFEKNLLRVCSMPENSTVINFLVNNIKIMKWIFKKEEGAAVTLVDLPSVTLVFNSDQFLYTATIFSVDGEPEKTFDGLSKALSYLNSVDPDVAKVNGFDFLGYLSANKSLVEDIENLREVEYVCT